MIYRDRVAVWMKPLTGYEEWGDPIYAAEWEETPGVPAEVFPLDTDYVLSGSRSALVISRYRVVMKAVFDLPQVVPPSFKISWGAYQITDPALGGPGLEVDGSIEHHHFRGRLHHYEFISKTVT